MSHLDPPPELPPIGKALYWVIWFAGMALVIVFAFPWLDAYVATPFANWVAGAIFGS